MLQRGDEPIPGYKLEKFLGKGTFGEVWRAAAPFGVKVALKFIDISGKAGLKEFRGIQRVKDIRHAHLMPITAIWMLDEYGKILDESAIEQLQGHQPDPRATMALHQFHEDEGPKPSLLVVAMLLADKSLTTRLEECNEETGYGIPLEELLDYSEQAARGIDFMNLKDHVVVGGTVKIQHCDIKPENMMLVGDSVVICDFGLAQLLGDVQKTATGALGTPAYISPEVLLNQRPSNTTDQYSFACSYYHLRTGELPFESTTSLPHVFEIVKNGKLDFRQVSGSGERSVLRRASSVDPNKRYPSCVEFVRELRRSIQEDRLVAEEATGDKLKRYAKYVALLLLIASVVGGGSYLGGTPDGREMAREWFNNVTSSGTTTTTGTTGTGTTGGGGRPSFAVVSRLPEQQAQNGQWQESLQELRGLAGDYPEETDAKRLEFITKMSELSTAELETRTADGAAKAADRYDIALGDLQASPLLETKLEAELRLDRARAAARLADWPEVQQQLVAVAANEESYDPARQRQFLILRVLAKTQDDPNRILDDESLSDLEQLDGATADQIGQWEADALSGLKVVAFEVLEGGGVALDLSDRRLRHIFGNDIDTLKTLADANAALSSSDADGVPFAELARQLATAQRQSAAKPGILARVEYFQSLLAIRDPETKLAELFESLPKQFANSEQARMLLTALINRLELEAEKNALRLSELQKVAPVVQMANRWLNEDAKPLQLRMTALLLAHEVQQGEFDWESVLQASQSIRDAQLELPTAIQAVVDAAWVEAVLTAADAGRRQPDNVYQQIDSLEARLGAANLPASADGYVQYVLARIATSRASGGDPVRVIQQLLPALTTDPLPVFWSAQHRRQFAARLLVTTAQKLRTAGDDQVSDPVYVEHAAQQASRYLEVAMTKLGVTSAEAQRNLVLAHFYAAQPKFGRIIELVSELKPSPNQQDDGQLLLARALAASRTPAVSAHGALTAFSDLFGWWSRFDNSNSDLSFYQQAVQPALETAKPLLVSIANFRDYNAAVDVASVPENVRPQLARVCEISARLVEEDFDTQQTLYRGKFEKEVEHRYFFYRAAAALDPQKISHLFGQFLAVRHSDRDSDDMVGELVAIARRAETTDSAHPATNGMLAESRVYQSRMIVDTARRKKLLNEALRYFDIAITTNDRQARATYTFFRSTACVESAFLMRVDSAKIARLEEAIENAQQAVDARYHPKEMALIAWGNGAEDLAFYCKRDRDRFYPVALAKFTDAAREALTFGRNAALGYLSAGRCRWRRTQQIVDGDYEPRQDINRRDEIEQAIEELTKAAEDPDSKRRMAESLFFMGQALALKARILPAGAGREEASASADQAYLEAISLADKLHWAQYQFAWASRAYYLGKLPEARQRAEELLAAREGGRFVVHWNYTFEALRLILYATPVDGRQNALTEYAKYVPENDEAAVPIRVRWFLTYADLHRQDLDQKNMPGYARFARIAADLAAKANDPELDALAKITLGNVAFKQWMNEPTNGELLGRADRQLVGALTAVESMPQDALDPMAVGGCYMYYGAIQSALLMRTADPTTKTRIKTDALDRLTKYQRLRNTPDAVKRQLQKAIDRLKAGT
jgi:serine/threonine protein kinase